MTGAVDHIDVLTVLAEQDITLERIHQTYKVVDYTCQQLL